MINKKKKELEIYLHIPFCVRKCGYCDFLSFAAGVEVRERYVERLLEEIKQSRELGQRYKVATVFIGGGTPSILEGEGIARILKQIQAVFSLQEDAEITIEANPGTVNREKLGIYRAVGINRISFGLQSTEDKELKRLGRIHTYQEFLESFEMAREAGFQNINVDLMSALPGQTLESWCKTLERITKLSPEHISAYSLILEEGTDFYRKYQGHQEYLPSEEEERLMYECTGEILSRWGYQQYEISNYAREGYRCRHNLGYWERAEYKGYGLGAVSLLENIRMTNQTDIKEYLRGNYAKSEEHLTEEAIREEYFFLGLRKTEGVEIGIYQEHYQELLYKLQMQQLLAEKDGRIYLTKRGIDVSNYVFAQFIDG